MTTFLAKNHTCGGCGGPKAQLLCPCKQIGFGSEACQKAAWSAHRLKCTQKTTSGKGKKKDGKQKKLTHGDLVEIQGLQSETGMTMNGFLAEVQSFDNEKDRYHVAFTKMDDKRIGVQEALVRRENLKLKLSTGDAACQGKKEEELLIEEWKRMVGENLNLTRDFPSPTVLVQNVREGRDHHHLLYSMLTCAPELAPGVIYSWFDAGLVHGCLSHYSFPLHLDAKSKLLDAHPRMAAVTVLLLSALLEALERDSQVARRTAVHRQVAQHLGPLILLLSTPKRRLFGATEQWWSVQNEGLGILTKVVADPAALQVLLKQQPKIVYQALLQHVVFLLTIDPMVFLSTKSSLAQDIAAEDFMARVNNFDLAVDLANVLADETLVGSSKVMDLGTTRIPAGARCGRSGASMCQSFVDVLATAVLDMPGYPLRVYAKWFGVMKKMLRAWHISGYVEGGQTHSYPDYQDFLEMRAPEFVQWCRLDYAPAFETNISKNYYCCFATKDDNQQQA